ncbi:type II toxin-antitoxin system VapC family toxin [Frankia sp. Cas4]|uniref:type II toxin-antitoxin system VapC family toxin n=1 Tax=Frankia sp. Cas4 TaxID=3073927 RepID=UPI003A1023CD
MVTDRHSRGLLDTNVIVHLPRVDPDELPIETAISSITLTELTAGPHATNDPVERAVRIGRLQRTEATYDPLPFDAEAARHYGPVYAAVLAANRTPRRRLADLLIACVAVANNLPLYTINPDDFTGLERLVRVVPVTRPR